MIWGNPSAGASIRDAIQIGDVEAAEAMLEIDPSLAKKFNDGSTPLHFVAQYGSVDLAKLLIMYEADVNARDEGLGATPLHFAAKHEDVAKLLLANGADPNARDKGGAAPLHYAAPYGHIGMVTLLLANKADVNATSKDGRIPLHGAANGGHAGNMGIAKALLAAGANIDARDDKGSTPLRLADQAGQTEMVNMLLASGASRNTKNYAEMEEDKIREKMIYCRDEAELLEEIDSQKEDENDWLNENKNSINNYGVDNYNRHVRAYNSLLERYKNKKNNLIRNCNQLRTNNTITKEVCGGRHNLFCNGVNQQIR